MLALGQPPELASQGQTFLRAYMWCTAPWLLFQPLRNFLSALERPRIDPLAERSAGSRSTRC